MALTLITGTSTGIGMATALAFGRAGHNVQATMRNPARAPELAQIAARESLPITISAMDVDSDSSVAECFARITSEAGPIEVLVNNAGVGKLGAVEDASLDLFKSTMETNFFGALRCIKAVLPGMRRRKNGCIINVTSTAGRLAIGGHGSYCASKWALEALSESLAQEVKAFNIRVAIVEPGVIKTPIFDKVEDLRTDTVYPHERRVSALFQATLKNPVHPEVVGEAIRYIADSGTWQLRHPIGPDAAPGLAWRSTLTDEQWVDFWAQSDADWCAAIMRDMGLEIDLAETLPAKRLKSLL